MHLWLRRCRWRLLWFALPLLLSAADSGTVLGPGASREHVIRTFGPPTGQTKAGTKEILTYPQGRVTLNRDLVERIEFKPNVPWPSAPRPASSATAVPVSNPRPATDPKAWQTDFAEVTQAAVRRNANILAVFTGTDWKAGDDVLMEDVLRHPEFARVFATTYLLFHADLENPGSAAVQNQRLRERYGITVFPALLMLAPDGTKLTRIDVSRSGGGSYRARVFSAVREAHDLLGFAPLPPVRPEFLAPAQATAAKGSPSAVAGLFSSASLALQALAVGVGVALLLFWLVWRDWVQPPPIPKPLVVAARIEEAASGLPTYEDIVTWPREKVRAVAQRLAEGDGFRVEPQAEDADRDLVLRREGEDHPRAYVCCSSGKSGIVTVRRVRELLGSLTADGVATGWFYAPSGFAAEARAFAAQHQLTLIDGHGLHARLRDLGPLALGRVVNPS